MRQVIPVLLFSACIAFGQTTTAPLAFEVASIKPAGALDPAAIASGKMRIGMKIDAARVDIGSFSLADLIRTAYKVKAYQVSGPDWMGGERFNIMAKLPDGAREDQVPEMLQALLAERFKLVIHRASNTQNVYALVVAKGGHKLKEAEPDAAVPKPEPPPGGITMETGQGTVRMSGNIQGKGMVISGGPNGGQTKMTMTPAGTMRMENNRMPMSGFADIIARFVDKPVVDMTELKGNYQIALDLSMDDLRNVARSAGGMVPGAPAGGGDPSRPADAASDPSGGTVFASVQQLGLKLEPRKSPIDLIVVDHLEKAPTEN